MQITNDTLKEAFLNLVSFAQEIKKDCISVLVTDVIIPILH